MPVSIIEPVPMEHPSFACELPPWLGECLRANEGDRDRFLIASAFRFAYDLHATQRRKSGDLYICHPIAVADILRDLGANAATIAAGFLHDIVEDTETSIQEIEERFGSETAILVEGVTKLSKFNFASKREQQAENFRRMFLAMSQDIRVIVVKLADRLHNMRTLEHLADEKRRRIAQETRDIFAPLANRLGLGQIKWELEDLAFKYIEPERYREIQDLVSEKRTDREQRIKNVIEIFKHRLKVAGISYEEISGRPKHLYGIYQKMSRQNKEFNEILDITALRILTKEKADCYRVLAEVHDEFKPIPGRFKDYIGLPKANQYQSLHTTVIGSTGTPLEVQIRTLEMHHIAEYGIAAHWKYKESGNSQPSKRSETDEKFTWLRQLLEWQTEVKDAQEYIESVREDMSQHHDDRQIYAFTPKGEVIPIRKGGTPIDFAYRIHTEVGNHCFGAKVNSRMVPLSTRLQNGDIVEILTRENSHPSLDWLNFVVTPGARNRITQWYKRSHRNDNMDRGRELLEKELGKSGLDALLKSEPLQIIAQKFNYSSVDDLLAGLGYGEVTLNQVVNRIREAIQATVPEEVRSIPAKKATATADRNDRPILGIEGLMYHLAGCCTPIPGEGIVGVVTRERGISVHRQGCPNVENVDGNRILPVSWNLHNTGSNGKPATYPVSVRVEVVDRVGVLKDVLSRLSDNRIDVRQAKVTTFAGKPAAIDLSIAIVDKVQLERCFSQIKQMSDVIDIRRLSEIIDN
jgi:GTP pyrophosphokinase